MSLFRSSSEPDPPRIVGIEQIESVPSLAFPIFVRVITVEFRSMLSSLAGEATLMLGLAPINNPNLRLHFHFAGVRDLQIPRLPAEGATCAYFQIEDVSALGWAKIAWKVSDLQSDTISFYAREASLVSVCFE